MTRPHVLYLSYNSLVSPLGASQILPYLRGLTSRWRFTVVSFESGAAKNSVDPIATERELRSAGNSWIRLPYHPDTWLGAKLRDFGAAARLIRSVHAKDPVALKHARGFIPGAILSFDPSPAPLLLDIRGLLAEEYVDAGAWKRTSVRFRLASYLESRALRAADGIVTLTRRVAPEMQRRAGEDLPSAVIPCAVDLDHFRFRPEARARIRESLGIEESECLFVHSGSIGTWYSLRDEASFVERECRRRKARLLVLTHAEPALVERELANAISPARVIIRSASSAEMPEYLAAADICLGFVTPSPSKRASCPTKIAEALAVGTPVLVLPGVGDLDELADEFPRSIAPFDGRDEIVARLGANREETRTIAESRFALATAVERYARLYDSLLGN